MHCQAYKRSFFLRFLFCLVKHNGKSSDSKSGCSNRFSLKDKGNPVYFLGFGKTLQAVALLQRRNPSCILTGTRCEYGQFLLTSTNFPKQKWAWGNDLEKNEFLRILRHTAFFHRLHLNCGRFFHPSF